MELVLHRGKSQRSFGWNRNSFFCSQTDGTHTAEYYAPLLLHIPSGSISDNEAAELALHMSTYPETASAADVAMLRGQRFSFGGSTDYFGKATHANSADRVYTFPDQAGTVLVGGSSGFGNGSSGTAVTTTAKNTGTGPSAPQTVVKYAPVIYEGQTYWIPLTQ